MHPHRITAVVGCLSVLAFSTAPAMADPGDAAMVREAHFSPDTPSVDVYLSAFSGGTTTLALSNVGYGDISDYQRLAPGLYTVGMRPAGADPSTPVAISWTLDAKPGQAFTALAIGMNKSLQGRVLSDDLTAPPSGQAKVRVIQAADRAAKADFSTQNGPALGTAVPFATTTDYITTPAGSWPLTARATDNPTIATTANLELTAGRTSTVVLLDAPQNGIALRFVDDAVGTNRPPAGPVEAGAGGTAGSSVLTDVAVGIGAVAGAVTLVLAGTAIRRRPQ